MAPAEEKTFARISYSIPTGAAPGPVELSFENATVYDSSFGEIHSCYPVIEVGGQCLGTRITIVAPAGLPTQTPTPQTTPTPSPTSAGVGSTPTATPTDDVYLALDCDARAPGWQSVCHYPLSAESIDVGVLLVTSPAARLNFFDFRVRSADTSRLVPPPMPVSVDGNPDFNQSLLGNGWSCTPPFQPVADDGSAGVGVSVSVLGCSTSSPFQLPSISELATIRYDVPSAALPGTIAIDFEQGTANGSPPLSSYAHQCFLLPQYENEFSRMPCFGATVILQANLGTTTPTSTSTPAPGISKIPEGNANNTDLSIPAANLWICEAPAACAGPGEGALRVVERASGVADGLGAYEFTVEYDNFVIQSVNPCDLVFGPGGAGSARGPVDELNSSAINPDCAPDPNNPTNGTCAMSLILENVVHFGCVSSGQAAGPTGNFDLASLLLFPHPDLNNDLFPGNNNGVLTVLKDNGCELVDIYGHPVSGSINGGLTPYCRDLAVTVRILEGDLDLDCDVDLADAQAIAARYGAFFGGLLYSKWYDLEPQFHDLDIDIKDVQKVFGRQDSTCQTPIPAQSPLGPPAAFGD